MSNSTQAKCVNLFIPFRSIPPHTPAVRELTSTLIVDDSTDMRRMMRQVINLLNEAQ